ncbi:MAG: hypothetical protein MUO62_07240, partial [Anaerolineales bacterium]|nr:hypothetical protein [Anaerolineales bacterium]
FNTDILATLTPGHRLGQTLVSHRPRLDGITLWFQVPDPDTPLSMDLYALPAGETPIFSTTFLAHSGANSILIPPQPDPPGQGYELRLHLEQGEIQILGRNEDVYPLGTATQDGRLLDADLAFRATYQYDWRAVLVDLGALAKSTWLVLPLSLLLFVPGWLLLDFSGQRQDFDPGEQIAVAVGLSVALVPLVMLWTTTLGLSWSRGAVLAGAGLLGLLYTWRVLRALRSGDPAAWWKSARRSPEIIILGAIFALALFVRFAMVRDLAAPPWVDSVHHTLVTQKIIEAGAYPADYLPHLPLESSRYHPGYHSLLAAFHWLTGLPLPEAMLVFGQVLNALMVFSLYLLATTLLKDKKAGLAAALIAAALSLMPAYYTSWGRYTQLTGLLVLPVGLRWILSAPKTTSKFSTFSLGAVSLAGLFMVHYRVVIFLGALLLAWWLGGLYRPGKNTRRELAASIQTSLTLAVLSMLVCLPWLIATFSEFVLPIASKWQANSGPLPAVHWRFFTTVLGVPVLVLAALGLVWGIIQRRRFTITLLVWVFILIGLANPGTFHIPFPGGFLNQTSVEIILFIPLSLLAGYLAAQILALGRKRLPARWLTIWNGAFLVLGASLGVLGAKRMLPSLNPDTFLYRQADSAALAWIQENLPPDETI